MRFTGTIKTWNDDRGFGFLEPSQGGQEVFVHIKALPSGVGRPSLGQVLTFEVETGADGKKRARAVQYPLRAKQQQRPRVEYQAPWTLPRVLAIPIFLGIYAFVVWRWGFSPPLMFAYLGLSLLTFLVYALDKSAAMSGRWRTAEQTLHLFSLAGGWPGALLAQQLLRHKTSKQNFVLVFWLTVLLNIGIFVAWHAGLLPASNLANAQVPPSAQEIARFAPLHDAAHRGNVKAIEAAAAAKADLNARDSYGRTPLHVAVFARERAAVQALVKAGANINLLENDRYDGITIASVADDEETLTLLIALGADAKLITSRYDGSALIAAAHLGHDGVVRQLIAAGAALDHVNNLNWTAVIESIVLGDGGKRHQASLEALIKAKANLQLTDRSGNTPLALARQRGYAAMVRMLEAAGAR